jgi:drug/metabolite transporter (DMT)-like permease
VPYALALLSAAFYGAADFLGGLAARRAHTSAVVVVSGLAGLTLLALLLPLIPGEPTMSDIRWGATAGVAGGVGIGLLYRALAIGRMAVVAPTTAVCAVIIPALASFLAGERLSAITVAGIVLALVAIVLVAQTPAPRDAAAWSTNDSRPPDEVVIGAGHERQHEAAAVGRRGIGIALLSGVAIGIFYLALARTSPAAGLWPLLAARATSVALFAALAIVGRQSMRMEGPVLRTVLLGGALDMIANALYVLATRGGPLSVVVTLSSLYPASTVVLARVVLGERLSALQIAGVLCALVAVVLIVTGA